MPGGSSSRGNLTIVVIFIGLGRAYRLERRGGILKLSNGGQATKGWDHFYGESWPLKTPCKDFNLDEMAKKGGREMSIFHAIIPALYTFW